MPRCKDITGQKFGRWTVESFSHVGKKRNYHWHVICECGTRKTLAGCSLRSKKTLSCGCLRQELLSISRSKHSQSKLKEYDVWNAMLNRCTNKQNKNYKNYGARGITVCERWKNVENFISDMGECPKGLSLDRINNDGDYEPNNCRWTSRTIQSINTRTRKDNKLGIKGVHWDERTKKYTAQITMNKRNTFLGRFSKLEDAIFARNKANTFRDSLLSIQQNPAQSEIASTGKKCPQRSCE